VEMALKTGSATFQVLTDVVHTSSEKVDKEEPKKGSVRELEHLCGQLLDMHTLAGIKHKGIYFGFWILSFRSKQVDS